ncbi:hypothetical protein KIN20_016370 [Parelaphostrongylus tenuis]|uniref:Uncharacterized protein n=1 Tax=Parelaphostrongylus tenuis TaxID=148309 RepID=A0AAD5QMW4_PARTN|nr:hypothetical protein KIN20_016370 [Parelaphostrongylus tenuis]
MVYDASLGYDPEEWEECPHKEQIMVFSFFTRLLLSSVAVAFVVYFFRLIDGNKQKDEKQLVKSKSEEVSSVPGTAEELLKEANDYMKDLTQHVKDGISGAVKAVTTSHLPETFTQFIEEPRRKAEEALRKDVNREESSRLQQIPVGAGSGSFDQPQQRPQTQVTSATKYKISKEDEQALRQWELEREMMEAERLAKLQDHEVGGDESDRTSGMLPASHISFLSGLTQEDDLVHKREPSRTDQPSSQLERKILTEIGHIAESTPTVRQQSFTPCLFSTVVQNYTYMR